MENEEEVCKRWYGVPWQEETYADYTLKTYCVRAAVLSVTGTRKAGKKNEAQFFGEKLNFSYFVLKLLKRRWSDTQEH